MQPRMKQPLYVLPDAVQTLHGLGAIIEQGGVPKVTLELCNLRASQINGCSVCLEGHARILKKAGESDERLFAVAGWRDAPYYTDAERAALALTEAMTRIADREDPVPDKLWEEAKRHYDERALAALLVGIATINWINRLNVATQQVAGSWKP